MLIRSLPGWRSKISLPRADFTRASAVLAIAIAVVAGKTSGNGSARVALATALHVVEAALALFGTPALWTLHVYHLCEIE